MPTLEELRAQRAALDDAIRVEEIAAEKLAKLANAEKAITLLSVLKTAKAELDKIWPGLFEGDRWEAFNTPTAWPRNTSMKKAADLSETEIGNAAHKGAKAVEKLVG